MHARVPSRTSLIQVPRPEGLPENDAGQNGALNVSVSDLEAMSFQVSAHLTSTLNAIAEKAADLIKAELEHSGPAAVSCP